MRQTVVALWAAVTGRPDLPVHRGVEVHRLEQSRWPQVVSTWSRLTPSGFPVELTAGPPGTPAHWSAEVAGPEVPEAERLGRVTDLLAAAGTPVAPTLGAALRVAQSRGPLQYGAWLGGREAAGTPARLKLYAELPPGTGAGTLPLPASLREPLARLPAAVPRMLGVEPAADRVELYLRLPALDPDELAAVLAGIGHAPAAAALDRGLPDGLRRLYGRRVGLSLADRGDAGAEIALFVTARTLFPAGPELLEALAPQVAGLDARFRPAAVTLAPHGPRGELVAAVGVAPVRARSAGHLRRAPVTAGTEQG